MDSLNNFLLLQIIDKLSLKEKSNLKKVNKRFNKIIDLSEEHGEWKLKRARSATLMKHNMVSDDNIMAREIVFDSDGVRTVTYYAKNVDWMNLYQGCIYRISCRSNWKLYESLVIHENIQSLVPEFQQVIITDIITTIRDGKKEIQNTTNKLEVDLLQE